MPQYLIIEHRIKYIMPEENDCNHVFQKITYDHHYFASLTPSYCINCTIIHYSIGSNFYPFGVAATIIGMLLHTKSMCTNAE